MKRLLLVLFALMLFGSIQAQRKDFTITNGALNWSTDLGTFSGMPVKISESADAAIYSNFGMKLAVLERRGDDFPKHTINGDTTYSFQEFLLKYIENGGGPRATYAPIDYADAITSGLVDGVTVVDKFGYNPEITSVSAPEEIWEFSEPYNYDADGTAPIQYLSSSSALDVGQPILVQGLDIDGYLVSQTVTTNGQSIVNLDTALFRVFRMINVSSTDDINGVIYCHTSPTVTAGVPPTISVRAIINGDNNQTLMAIYTIPRGYVGKLRRGEFMVGLDGNSGALAENTDIIYKSRRYGQLFTLKKIVKLMIGGSPVYQDLRPYPDVVPALTDIAFIVESTTATVGVSATFHIELVEERMFSEEFLRSIGQIGY